MAGETILVVDDEIELAELLRDYLKSEGFEVLLAYDGETALQTYRNRRPHLIILDIMLPKIDGMEVCRIIRNESNIPVIMLSAKKGDIDKILSLGLGADDYVTKPFSPGELVARVKAQLRRFTLNTSLNQTTKTSDSPSYLKCNELELDSKQHNVSIHHRPIELSAKEFEILQFLMEHPKQVFSRVQIFDQIWGTQEFGDINTVTVHIRKIREKIETDPSHPNYIKTVWGVGYKFDGGCHVLRN